MPTAREAMFSRPGFVLRSVIHECDNMQVERFHGVTIGGAAEPMVKQLREVIDRGIRRGEVRADVTNGYVLDAIPAKTTYRSKMCGSEWSVQGIEEMIDQSMVPPLCRRGV